MTKNIHAESNLILRQMIGYLGMALPILNSLFAAINGHPIIPSISSTHYMNSYAIFEGLVFAVGLFLIAYRGYDKQDFIISTIAGAGAILLVIFPCSTKHLGPEYQSLTTHNLFGLSEGITNVLHLIGAGTFFLLLAYMILFQFTKSSGKETEAKKKRNLVYRVCGIIMLLALSTFILDGFGLTFFLGPVGLIYIGEAIALEAFGVSWLVKGEVLLADK